MIRRRFALAAVLWLVLAAGAQAMGTSTVLDALMKREELVKWLKTSMTVPALREVGTLPLPQARRRLDAVLAGDPDDVLARALRATVEARLHDFAAALPDLDQAIAARGPLLAPLLTLRAEILLELHRDADALADAERAVAASADVPPDLAAVIPPAGAYSARGWAFKRAHRYPEALRDLDQAVALGGADAADLQRRGIVHELLDQEERSLADLKRAVSLVPDDTDWRYDLAVCFWHFHHFDLAHAELDTLIGQAPDTMRAWALRSRMDVALERWDDADVDATHALSLPGEPGDQANAYWARAMTWLHRNESAKALADVARGEALAPGRSELPALRGLIEYHDQHWERAKAARTRALELDPDCPSCLSQRAVSEAHLGENAAALADARKAIEMLPDSSRMHQDYADVLAQLHDWPAAIAQYDIAIALDRSAAPAPLDENTDEPWIRRADAREAAGDHATAIAEYTAILDRVPALDRKRVLAGRGLAFVLSNDFPHAIADLRAAVRLAPQYHLAQMGLGAVLEQSGDLSGAADAYLASAALRPDANLSWRAARQLVHVGRIAEAAAPLRVALHGGTKAGPYEALWVYVSRTRAHPAEENEARQELAELAPAHDPRVWTDSLVDFLQGRIDLQTLEQRAEEGPAAKRVGLHCEAHYYAAEVALAHGRRDEAVPLMAEAARACPSNYVEAHAAQAEARLLGTWKEAD